MAWSRRFAFQFFFFSLSSSDSSDSNDSIISLSSVTPRNLRDVSIVASVPTLFSSVVFLSFSTSWVNEVGYTLRDRRFHFCFFDTLSAFCFVTCDTDCLSAVLLHVHCHARTHNFAWTDGLFGLATHKQLDSPTLEDYDTIKQKHHTKEKLKMASGIPFLTVAQFPCFHLHFGCNSHSANKGDETVCTKKKWCKPAVRRASHLKIRKITTIPARSPSCSRQCKTASFS